MTGHPLDNHLWNALNGPLASESRAVGRVRLLTPDIGSVAALEAVSPANAHTLATAIPLGAEILAIAPIPLEHSDELEVLQVTPVLQMIAMRPAPPDRAISTTKLGAADFSKMLALVDIARPGPLGPRAMELGGFRGIFEGDELVALAGERLRLEGFTEVATVCTHPDYRGRGLGKAVASAVVQGIVDAGSVPFLGVDAGNTPAIRLYEQLGFTHRSTFYLSLVRRVR
jgi:ribosomal protein S18 acetylase RimI-like enzyme